MNLRLISYRFIVSFLTTKACSFMLKTVKNRTSKREECNRVCSLSGAAAAASVAVLPSAADVEPPAAKKQRISHYRRPSPPSSGYATTSSGERQASDNEDDRTNGSYIYTHFSPSHFIDFLYIILLFDLQLAFVTQEFVCLSDLIRYRRNPKPFT